MKKPIYLMLSFFLLVFVGCTENVTKENVEESELEESTPVVVGDLPEVLHINGFTLGQVFEDVMDTFGQPLKSDQLDNSHSLTYADDGVGIRINLAEQSKKVIKLYVYPPYMETINLPKTKNDILAAYGQPNEGIVTNTCGNNERCDGWVYEVNGEQLIVQFDSEGVHVQYLILEKIN
ncbi:hypothetical protein EJF36_02880 [Bacillus sp. HMF5848]|uniref:hypothetical protein n=1 Tax=Bacillus sp. HMF5848 TaxID=2495421 RepID=UPI000F7B7733|nr:hypothetical protein [Bacillus sp. HMF5848]RSK25921.1 hypothetical protein EJF36_02880 [Bacillus sp. HMF5848]